MDKIGTPFSGPASAQAVEAAQAAQAAQEATPRPVPAEAPRRQTPPPAQSDRRDADTVSIKAIFPPRDIRLVIDEATGITQVQVRDADSGKVLRKFPDDDWLKESAILREFASQAIVDKSA